MKIKKSLGLSIKFWEGLKEKYNLTFEDIKNEGWAYAGGNIEGRHFNYLTTLLCENKNLLQPPHSRKCVCDHDISYNCYIADKAKTKMIVVGSCCINSFMPEGKKGRTCGECGKPHRNMKDNVCKECRSKKKVKICLICGKTHRNRNINKCNDCKLICSRCKTVISRYPYNKNYETCLRCERIKECILCKKEHTNRVDKCNDCCNKFKCGICIDCGKKCNEIYNQCYPCYKKKSL